MKRGNLIGQLNIDFILMKFIVNLFVVYLLIYSQSTRIHTLLLYW